MTASQAADDDVVVYQSIRERPKPTQSLDALHRILRFAALMGSLLLCALTALLQLAIISGAHEWPLWWLTGVPLVGIVIAAVAGAIRVFSAARRVSP
ncbi:hypothetical protein HGQ17_11540 [Nesterenkonia sp. MY13]|uniref:Uncharacterized protein n=1 Tax=Nesterenkonia sedimenti TaxID=1463632 RepID=A0A7X8TKS7_9MICC|nr:hypothetical protein [Nesterenkonia sedimenti]NLS10611.1 hypothetical protein [Nesterenkonia sedimenti]